jgi:hypothetical protein
MGFVIENILDAAIFPQIMMGLPHSSRDHLAYQQLTDEKYSYTCFSYILK